MAFDGLYCLAIQYEREEFLFINKKRECQKITTHMWM